MNDQNLHAKIKASWENPEHTRLRITPRYADTEYPVFTDLNEFIKQNGSQERLTILDFGAGNSPYKPHFPHADYRTADILDGPGLTYHIGANGQIHERDEVFDLILSTQVLEHVRDVPAYLAEAHRLLKKGGKLLLTTHGIWEEHGVPHDFQRWTEEGMKRDLTAANFHEIEVFKLTSGFRATLFIFIKGLFIAMPPRPLLARFFFKAFRFTISRLFPFFYRVSDRYWPEEKITRAGQSDFNPASYIIIAALATKSFHEN
jgi:SAM-dependent methyltransferase